MAPGIPGKYGGRVFTRAFAATKAAAMKRLCFCLLVLMASAAHGVVLEWDVNTDEVEGYRLFRRPDGHNYNYDDPLVDTTATRYTDSRTEPGWTYHYVVRAYAGDNESGDSNEVTYSAPAGEPPGDLAGLTLKTEGKIMFLIADPVPDGTTSDGTDYFEVEIDGAIVRSDGESDGAGQTRLRHDLTGLSFGDHQARARALNSWGAGDWTAPLSFKASSPGALSGFGLSDN